MWLRRTLSVILAAGTAVGCSDHQNANKVVEVKQSCDSCAWKEAEVSFVDAIPSDKFRITRATAVEYFNVVNRTATDSVIRKRFSEDSQWRYNLIDQYGYYSGNIKPGLIAAKIDVIDTLNWRTVLFFEDEKHEYIVDVSAYKNRDGVLLYKPGKAPIFWTMDLYKSNCADSTLLQCYFGD